MQTNNIILSVLIVIVLVLAVVIAVLVWLSVADGCYWNGGAKLLNASAARPSCYSRSANRALMTSRSSVKLRARLNIHSSRFHSKKKLEKLEFKKKFKIK